MGKITEDMRLGAVICSSLTVDSASVTNAMCSPSMGLARSKLAQDTLQAYGIDLASLRVHDAMHTVLPAAGATDDLGYVTGTLGTESNHLSAGNLGSAGATTRYARGTVCLPPEYDDAETVQIEVTRGVQTAVADASCLADVELYLIDEDLTVSADLVTTAATSINTLSPTYTVVPFTVTATSLVAGSLLDYRIAITCTDAATGTVEPTITALKLLCDIRG